MFDLTKISFDELVDQLLVKLKEKDAWKDANLTSTGRTIIELYAYVAQLLLYYIKRSYEEMFSDSAMYWESLVKIANMLEVYVKRPSGCSGRVKIVPVQSLTTSVVVPARTVITCDDVSFYTVEQVTVSPTDTYVEVGVRQGIERVVSYTVGSVSGAKLEYKIVNPYASDLDMMVSVNGVQYMVNTYLFETLDDLQVKVYTDADKSMVVQFVKGFGLPNPGDVVEVRYFEVDPGYFPEVGSEWVINDKRFSVEPMLETFAKGQDWETVEELRSRLSRFYGVGKKAVTKEDFEYLVKSVQGVKDVQVVDVKDYFQAPFREVEIYVATYSDVSDPKQVLLDVESVLNKLGSIGVSYVVKGVQYVDVNVYVVVRISRLYSTEAVRSEVLSRIQDLYNKVRIGRWVFRKEIESEVQMVNGVLGVSIIEPQVDLILKKGQVVRLKQVKVDVVVGT